MKVSDGPPFITSKQAQQCRNGRGTFLGFRNVRDLGRRTSSLGPLQSSSPNFVMPEGGLSPCVIRVLGVGGGGCNAVDRMLSSKVNGVEYWAINTDAQALGRSKVLGANTLNIGFETTKGLGAGGVPEQGRLAAEESREELAALIQGTDLCFITSGMGGGTGSGASPVVAEVAKESGALTVAIVTKPFSFEGKRRMNQAEEAIERLRKNVDSIIVLSNNKLLEMFPDNVSMKDSFVFADEVLRQGVVGIAEIIVKPGLVNIDFADISSVMKDSGNAMLGIGTGSGKNGCEDAAAAAVNSPLLDGPVQKATSVVFNVLGPPSLTLQDVNKAAEIIYEHASEDANVIFGALIDEELNDDAVAITVLGTGFDNKN